MCNSWIANNLFAPAASFSTFLISLFSFPSIFFYSSFDDTSLTPPTMFLSRLTFVQNLNLKITTASNTIVHNSSFQKQIFLFINLKVLIIERMQICRCHFFHKNQDTSETFELRCRLPQINSPVNILRINKYKWYVT